MSGLNPGTTLDVSTQAQLNTDIVDLQNAAPGDYTIAFTASFSDTGFTSDAHAVNGNGLLGIILPDGVSLTINGQGYTLDGGGTQSTSGSLGRDTGLAVLSGKVTIDSLTIEDTVARGGNGSEGSGGGAGLGGGLFVGAGSTVTVNDVTITQASARGGNGGPGGESNASGGVGGDSSLLFNRAAPAAMGETGEAGENAPEMAAPPEDGGPGGTGGDGAAGGIFQNGGNGGTGGRGGEGSEAFPPATTPGFTYAGQAGEGGDGGDGGKGGLGGAGGVGGRAGPGDAKGGDGGTGGVGAGGGGGGAGATGAHGGIFHYYGYGDAEITGGQGGDGGDGADGGFGGGAGGGGNGGAGGEGGANEARAAGAGGNGGDGGDGGDGGFGGGGGGGGVGGRAGEGGTPGPYSANYHSVTGAPGAAGDAGDAGDGGFGAGAGGSGAAGGGGGGGLGAGGDIFVQQGGSLILDGGLLTGGSVQGGSASAGGNPGGSAGAGIFIQGDQAITLAAPAGQVLVIDDPISDQTGAGGTGSQAGAGTLVIAGLGTVELAGSNDFSGGIDIQAGATLLLDAADAAGTGPITFSGTGALILNDSLNAIPDVPIDNFTTADLIEITGFSETTLAENGSELVMAGTIGSTGGGGGTGGQSKQVDLDLGSAVNQAASAVKSFSKSALTLIGGVKSTVYNWVGGTSAYANAAAWDPDTGPPGPSDIAIFSHGGTVTGDGTADIISVTASIAVSGTLTALVSANAVSTASGSTLDVSGGIVAPEIFNTNGGMLILESGGSLAIGGGASAGAVSGLLLDGTNLFNGGSVTTTTFDVGTGSGDGTATLTNGATVHASAAVVVGDQPGSAGTLAITSASAWLFSNDGTIGLSANSAGSVDVQGLWYVSDTLDVGDAGKGVLSVDASAASPVVRFNALIIGDTGSGTVTVGSASGGDARLLGSTSGGFAYVGDEGNGTLNILANGNADLNNLTIGANMGGQGTIIDAGTLDDTGTLVVGAYGAGSLDVSGNLGSGATALGVEAGSTAAVSVAGYWQINATSGSPGLTVGVGGSASLVITGSANLGGALLIATQATATGTVTIDGGGVSTATDPVIVGAGGVAALSVLNGGQLYTDEAAIGDGDNGTGSGAVTVDGSGSQGQSIFDIDGSLVVGQESPASLVVSNHGSVSANSLTVGAGAGEGVFGHATVTINGGTLAVSQGAAIGGNGGGTLTVEGGGTVAVGTLAIGGGATSVVDVTGAHSTLIATAVTFGVNGTLDVGGGAVLNAGTLHVQAGGTIHLVGGTVDPPGITLDTGALMTGYGQVIGPITEDGTVLATGGTLELTGAVSGDGTFDIAPGAALQFDSSVAASISIAFTAPGGTLLLGGGADVSAAIIGFGAGDAIGFTGQTVSSVLYDPNTDSLTLSGGGGGRATLALSGPYTAADFALSNGEVDVACFASGTRIAVADGTRRVEDLAVGDLVRTAGGEWAAIHWIGHRRVRCDRHSWPVRIRADAFHPGQPRRDLILSPDHAVFVDDVLIPIKYLVNGTTIVREPRHEAVYWHIELPRHDVVIAEGLPCESYLDTGNRGMFANGGDTMRLPGERRIGLWEAAGCAPLCIVGEQVAAVADRLRLRAMSRT